MFCMASELGERIKELRSARRLTQDQLAARVGVSRKTISNWETGETSISTDDLPAIAAALGVRQSELLEGPDPPGVGSRRHDPLDTDGQRGADRFNVNGRREDLRATGAKPLPIYRWGSLGDPRDRDSAFEDRWDYPPLGRERVVGPNGFGVDVRGDSMAGRGIRDGDTCWVNPERNWRFGDVVLALISDNDGEGGMVVKTYAQLDVGDCLVSETEAGRSTVVCDHFKIIGPVVLISPRPFPPR
jgi:transcriptional regulator with XRE-family HTH domain